MSTETRRILLAASPHLPAMLPATVLLLGSADRLPDPVAGHFGITGAADGFTGRATVVVIQLGLGVFLTVLFALAARRGRGAVALGTGDHGRFVVGAAWAVSGFLGVLFHVSAAVNLDLPDAGAAVLPGWWFPAAAAAAAVAGGIGYRIAPASEPGPAASPAEVLEIGTTEQVSWSRTVRSRPILLAGAALAVTGGGFALAGQPIAASVLVGTGVVLAVLHGGARVTVDRRGLRVTLGPLGWPRVVIPATDVVSAAATDVSPLGDFGGWGYRIRRGGAGLILRSGPAIVVTRRSGRRFTVTVDDAATAAELLNGVRSC
jgi:hypothetical protein